MSIKKIRPAYSGSDFFDGFRQEDKGIADKTKKRIHKGGYVFGAETVERNTFDAGIKTKRTHKSECAICLRQLAAGASDET